MTIHERGAAGEGPAGGGLRRLGRAVLFALAAALFAGEAGAQARSEPGASPWAATEQTAVRLISAVAAVGERQAIPVGLQFLLEPGWKTYWRSPGDAGLPVTVAWDGSENVARALMQWPAPHRYTLFGIDTFGYADEVVFPVVVTPARAGEPVGLRARVNYLVCEKICIPYEAALALDLPAGEPTPTQHVQTIDRFRTQVPGDGSLHGITLERVALAGDGDPVLEVAARSAIPFAAPDLFVEAPPGLYFGAPEVSLAEDGRLALLRLPVSVEAGAPDPAATPVTLTLVDGRHGLERTLVPGRGLAGAPDLPTVLALALLGGLILNLMPCVLPVLSLKLLGAVGLGGAAAATVRASFLASAAGVLAAFLVLAAGLAVLKEAGVAVGWGIQFQQPLFLVAMVLLLTLFACNLWGWLHVPLPGWVGELSAVTAAGRHDLLGAFAAGALATLLATPCSAPFVGTALGFALVRGTPEIFAVMGALGLGLALPYLAVAAMPRLALLLPRPGRWMMHLRRALGLALVGTAVWLLSILAALVDPEAAVVVAALMAAAAGALWARRRLPAVLRVASPAAVAALALLAFLAPAAVVRSPEPQAAVEAAWEPFDEARLDELVREGKTVLVDVSADWCITCLVNKRLVLDSAEVARRLAQPEVVAMRADWTRPDDAIARYLASFGRYGIPFNAVYGPRAPAGIALPELLSREAVLQALAAAGG